MRNDKSVVEYLSDIEEKLNSPFKQKSVSEMIDEPFDKYLETSTVYYYEPDERKFNKYRKRGITILVAMIFVCLFPLIAHIIISTVQQVIYPLIYVIDILLVICPLIDLIYVVKQTNKKKTESKWNLINQHYYIYENKLTYENNITIFAKMLFVYKIIIYILFLITPLIYTREILSLIFIPNWIYLFLVL